MYHNQKSGLVYLKDYQRHQRSSRKLGQAVMDAFCEHTKYDRVTSSLEDLCGQYVRSFLSATDSNIDMVDKPRLILDFGSCRFSSSGK